VVNEHPGTGQHQVRASEIDPFRALAQPVLNVESGDREDPRARIEVDKVGDLWSRTDPNRNVITLGRLTEATAGGLRGFAIKRLGRSSAES
jgi:hypothetical protein